MRKRYNVTGNCNHERHYMVDTEARFKAVERMIGFDANFSLN